MATMHKLVSPEGVLHLLPVDDRSILEFTKVHGIKDKKYLMNHLRGKQDESYGWQLLAKVESRDDVLHRVLLKFSRLYR